MKVTLYTAPVLLLYTPLPQTINNLICMLQTFVVVDGILFFHIWHVNIVIFICLSYQNVVMLQIMYYGWCFYFMCLKYLFMSMCIESSLFLVAVMIIHNTDLP